MRSELIAKQASRISETDIARGEFESPSEFERRRQNFIKKRDAAVDNSAVTSFVSRCSDWEIGRYEWETGTWCVVPRPRWDDRRLSKIEFPVILTNESLVEEYQATRYSTGEHLGYGVPWPTSSGIAQTIPGKAELIRSIQDQAELLVAYEPGIAGVSRKFYALNRNRSAELEHEIQFLSVTPKAYLLVVSGSKVSQDLLMKLNPQRFDYCGQVYYLLTIFTPK